jgi:hypothetical protein
MEKEGGENEERGCKNGFVRSAKIYIQEKN